MTGRIEYLNVEDLVCPAVMLLGDPPPVRDSRLLGAVALSKAAALLQSLVKNHPLVDGNKRLG